MPNDQHIPSIRTNKQVKMAIEAAARKSGRSVGNYLLWCAAQQDADVAKALGIDV